MASVLKTLGDANRLLIFGLLRQGERCVCDIESATRLPQNLVSHHLRALREVGLIECRRDGRWAYYAINLDTLRRVRDALDVLLNPNTVAITHASC